MGLGWAWDGAWVSSLEQGRTRIVAGRIRRRALASRAAGARPGRIPRQVAAASGANPLNLLHSLRQHPIVAVLWDTVRSLLAHDGIEMAGYMAFTALLALFPFLIFLAALSGLVSGYDTAATLVEFLVRFAPKDVAQTISPTIVEVTTHRRGGFLTISLIFSIWVASGAIDALRLTLNRAYEFHEHRSLWLQKLQSIFFVLVGGSSVFLVALLILLGPLLWKVVQWFLPLAVHEQQWIVARYALGAVVIAGITMLLHRFLPVRTPAWRQILPGALTASALWLLAAGLFTFYLSEFANYGSTYGALAGVVVTLLFFDISALIFIFAAELNAALCRADERRRRPATDGTDATPVG
jgi:membrane protein